MEFRAKLNCYIQLKEGETEEQATNRLLTILNKAQEDNKDFSTSEIYDSEIQ